MSKGEFDTTNDIPPDLKSFYQKEAEDALLEEQHQPTVEELDNTLNLLELFGDIEHVNTAIEVKHNERKPKSEESTS